MADWRKQTRSLARFRDAWFRPVEADLKVGRRNVAHEFPGRDDPFVEDLGRRARMFVVEGYVVGEDYLAERDALIAAIEQPGPGELLHPRYGLMQVAVQDYVSVKESTREGGMARFSITFIEHGKNTFPTSDADTVAALDAAAEASDDAAQDEFGEVFDVSGPGVLQESALAALQKDLTGALSLARTITDTSGLGEIVRDVAALSGTLTALIRTPVVFVQGLRSLNAQLIQALRRPVSALAELEAVFTSNRRTSSSALATSTRARVQVNEQARADLQRRLCLSNQARTLAVAMTSSVATSRQARQLRDRVFDQIDVELETSDPSAQVALTLTRLRSAVARDVSARLELLQEASTFTPSGVVPSLVLAHRIYQDAARAEELVSRNAIRHPAFVPARALEVLK